MSEPMLETGVKNQVILNEDDNVMLPEKEIMAFGMAGFAINITFIYMIAFVQFFWTDVLMIPATLVGIFMMVCKVWDALNDIIVAYFTDRSKWKKGFYIPWEWSFIPMIIFMCLVMNRGDGSRMFMVLTFVMYVFYTLFETFYEVPNLASLSTMTLNYRCRGKLTAHRQFFGNVAALIVTTSCIPLSMALGNGDMAQGWTKAAIVYGVIAAPFFVIGILGRKERFRPVQESGAQVSMKESIKCLKNNLPAWMIILAHFAWGVANGFGGAAKNYYWTYVYGDVTLISSTAWFGSGGMIIAAIVALLIAGRVKNKRDIPLVAWSFCALFNLIAFFLPIGPGSILPLKILLGLAQVGGQIGFITLFGIAPDVTEYSQQVHGLRNAGFIFAAINLAFQFGNAFTSGVFVTVLGAMGYVAGQTQTPAVLSLISLGSWLFPALGMAFGVFCWLKYKLNEQTHNEAIHRLSR
ncbi:MAG: MFS transporter [Peptococcaceae bacterium]|nr:MFS transporter [Peptococcaceae bacterium]